MVPDESGRRCTQKDRRKTRTSLLFFFFKRRCLFRQPNACQKELLQQQLSGFARSTRWRDTGLVENTELLPRHVSLVVVKGGGDGGDGGGWRSFSPGFGQSLLQSPVWAKKQTKRKGKKRIEVTHTPLTQNTQRDDKKDALTVGSIHMQYNVSPSD